MYFLMSTLISYNTKLDYGKGKYIAVRVDTYAMLYDKEMS